MPVHCVQIIQINSILKNGLDGEAVKPYVQIIQINSILKNFMVIVHEEDFVQIIQINSILKNVASNTFSNTLFK